MFFYGDNLKFQTYKNFLSKIYGQNTEMHKISLCHRYRDNICPLLSSPMASFNIELYETKLVNRKFLSIDTMWKA